MEIQVQEALSVPKKIRRLNVFILRRVEGNKLLFLFLILLFISEVKLYGQFELKGTYCVDYELKDFASCYTFNENGEFKYKNSGHLGVNKYGSGEFIIRDSLMILNYNKTKPKYSSYHKISFWESNGDSISINFKVLDIYNKKVFYAAIQLNSNEQIISKNDSNDMVGFKIEKNKKCNTFTIMSIGYDTHKFNLKFDKNYDIEVYLKEGNNVRTIRGRIENYKILNLIDEYLYIKNSKGINVVLKKL